MKLIVLPLCCLVGVAGAYRASGQVTLTNCTAAALHQAAREGGVFRLDCDGTIVLTNSIVVEENLTLDANGRNVAITGGNAVRLFVVPPGRQLILDHVTLINGRHGRPSGTNEVFDVNGEGGAIFNDGGLVILRNSNLSSNVVAGAEGSAGEDAELTGETGEDGRPGGHARGGAVYNRGGIVLVTNTVFRANSVVGGDGGDGGEGGPGALGGDGGDGGNGGPAEGGAIYNTANGTIFIDDSTFSSNRVTGSLGGFGGLPGGVLGFTGEFGVNGPASGGAVFNESGTVIVRRSTFMSQLCEGAGGLDGDDGTDSQSGLDGTTGGFARGAALYNRSGTLNVTNCTFVANRVLAGHGGNGGAGGSRGFGGDGGDGGDGGGGLGGAIFNGNLGSAAIVNCTFAQNGAEGGMGGEPGEGGGPVGREGDPGRLGPSQGGNLFNENGTMTIANSILVKAVAGSSCGGPITDLGNNMGTDRACHLGGPGSFLTSDPLLGPLTNNGGLTFTMALVSNSPAIDRGNDLICPPTDQRHARRVGACDIGAFEFGGPLPEQLLSITFQDATNHVVVLSWPASNLQWRVERTVALAPGATWTALTNQPTLISNRQIITLQGTNAAGFFRLRR